MLIFIITMLLVGYTEEALFRGLIQNAFHKIFGEESWQAVWAAGKCLWYVVIIHAFNDFCAFLKTGFLNGGSVADSISSTAIPVENLLQVLPVLAVMYLLPALFVLRPKKVKPLLGKVVI